MHQKIVNVFHFLLCRRGNPYRSLAHTHPRPPSTTVRVGARTLPHCRAKAVSKPQTSLTPLPPKLPFWVKISARTAMGRRARARGCLDLSKDRPTTDFLLFEDVRPNVVPNWQEHASSKKKGKKVKAPRGRKYRQSMDGGHFYCWMEKRGNLKRATNYTPFVDYCPRVVPGWGSRSPPTWGSRCANAGGGVSI